MSKISKEELKELQEQEQKKNAIKHDIGVLETQKHSLLHVWAEIVTQQEGAKKYAELLEGVASGATDLDGILASIAQEGDGVTANFGDFLPLVEELANEMEKLPDVSKN